MSLPETTSYSRSALFSGATVPVVARFSLGGGDPNAPDAGKGPRGMGLEFRLADYFRDDYADWGAKAEPMARSQSA